VQTRLVLQEDSLAKPGSAWDVPPGTLLGKNLAQLILLLANAFDQTKGT